MADDRMVLHVTITDDGDSLKLGWEEDLPDTPTAAAAVAVLTEALDDLARRVELAQVVHAQRRGGVWN